jgi:hypothetical protein
MATETTTVVHSFLLHASFSNFHSLPPNTTLPLFPSSLPPSIHSVSTQQLTLCALQQRILQHVELLLVHAELGGCSGGHTTVGLLVSCPTCSHDRNNCVCEKEWVCIYEREREGEMLLVSWWVRRCSPADAPAALPFLLADPASCACSETSASLESSWVRSGGMCLLGLGVWAGTEALQASM